MNTERRSRSQWGARPVPGRSGNIGAGAVEISSTVAGAWPLRAGTARAPKSSQRGMAESVSCRPFSVPEGHRRRLAGGKSAAADAAPGNRGEKSGAPAGHRRNGLGCRAIVGDAICPRQRAVVETHREGRRQRFLRCPAGAWRVWHDNRGLRPLARACPRLISFGVPPGPSTGLRR